MPESKTRICVLVEGPRGPLRVVAAGKTALLPELADGEGCGPSLPTPKTPRLPPKGSFLPIRFDCHPGRRENSLLALRLSPH